MHTNIMYVCIMFRLEACIAAPPTSVEVLCASRVFRCSLFCFVFPPFIVVLFTANVCVTDTNWGTWEYTGQTPFRVDSIRTGGNKTSLRARSLSYFRFRFPAQLRFNRQRLSKMSTWAPCGIPVSTASCFMRMIYFYCLLVCARVQLFVS